MAVKQKLDTPINNFATLNPLNYYYSSASNPTVSEGNLKFATTGGTYRIGSTLAVTSGKWYFEAYRNDATAVGNEIAIGVVDSSKQLGTGQYGGAQTNAGANANEWALTDRAFACNNTDYINTGLSSNSINQGKIVQVLIDMNLRSISWGVNNVWYYNAFTNLSDSVSPVVYTGTGTVTSNFGQDATFNGNATPTKVYTDARGLGRFYYQPPEGALALCTANLGRAINYKSAPTSYVSDETNTKILTYNGNVEQVPYSPYATDGYSLYSSNAGLKLTDTAANFNFLHNNTSDYTISFWMYRMQDVGSSEILVDSTGGTGGANGIYFLVDGGGTDKLRIYINRSNIPSAGSAFKFESNYVVPLRQWVHVSFVFDQTVADGAANKGKLYIDGALYDSGTYENNGSYNAGNSSQILTLGSAYDGSTHFYGYIADFRIVKNKTVTTSVPSSPYSVSETLQDILISASSNSIKDSNTAATAKTVTPVGSGEVSIAAWSPYSTDAIEFGTTYRTPETAHEIGSFSFDGTGDYLTTTISGGTGSGDFTIELWAYITNLHNYINWFGNTRGSTGFNIGTDASGAIVWYSSSAKQIDYAAGLKNNAWYHIAFVRLSGVITLYLDGVSVATYSSSTDYSDSTFEISRGTVSGEEHEGYISDFRFVKGTAVYTGAFTPPSGKLTATGGTYPSGINISAIPSGHTKLLLQPYKSYDANNLLTSNFSYNKDSSSTPKSLTYVGNTKVIDVSPYKSGANGSFKFDGNGDRIDLANNSDFNVGSGDFTIKFWMYGNDNSISTQHVFAKWNSNKEIRGFFEGSSSNRYTTFWFQYKTSSDSGDPWVDGGKFDNLPITPNSWNYFVFVKSGTSSNNTSLYVNGVSMTPTNNTIAGTVYSSTDDLFIGSSVDASAGFAGFITDFEFEKTAVSNPSAVPSNSVSSNSNTKLLLQPGALASNEPAKKPFEHFKCVTWTGQNTGGVYNHSTGKVTTGMSSDLVWIKSRDSSNSHNLNDSVRGVGKFLMSNSTSDEQNSSDGYNTDSSAGTSTILRSFDSDGFNVGNNANVNDDGNGMVAWTWKAGGKTPSKTYYVKSITGAYQFFGDVSNSGNLSNNPALSLQKGGTYTFDQSDSSNVGHPLRFYTANNGTEYSSGQTTNGITVTVVGSNGSAGAYTKISIASDASVSSVYYQCSQHSAMGNTVTLTTTHGQTEFGGSVIPIVSANKEAGFSIVKYTGNGTNGATLAHGLGKKPKIIIEKAYAGASTYYNWSVQGCGELWTPATSNLFLNTSNSLNASGAHGAPDSNTFHPSKTNYANENNVENIAYVWTDIEGYSAFGSYISNNGGTDSNFVYLGFKPALVILKATGMSVSGFQSYISWVIYDNTRQTANPNHSPLFANHSVSEGYRGDGTTGSGGNTLYVDFLSNGFKIRLDSAEFSANNTNPIIYMAFAEAPVNFSNAR